MVPVVCLSALFVCQVVLVVFVCVFCCSCFLCVIVCMHSGVHAFWRACLLAYFLSRWLTGVTAFTVLLLVLSEKQGGRSTATIALTRGATGNSQDAAD